MKEFVWLNLRFETLGTCDLSERENIQEVFTYRSGYGIFAHV